MKFIFPQNYNFRNKLFGIMDYSTAFVNLLWYIFVFILVNFIFNDLTLKIFIFVTFCFPLFLFSFSGINGQNILYVFSYFLSFFFKNKLFLYKK